MSQSCIALPRAALTLLTSHGPDERLDETVAGDRTKCRTLTVVALGCHSGRCLCVLYFSGVYVASANRHASFGSVARDV